MNIYFVYLCYSVFCCDCVCRHTSAVNILSVDCNGGTVWRTASLPATDLSVLRVLWIQCDIGECGIVCDIGECGIVCDIGECGIVCDIGECGIVCDIGECGIVCDIGECDVV